MSDTDPEGFVCAPVAIRDISVVRHLEAHEFPMTPRQFMARLAEHTFTPEETKEGKLMQYINRNIESFERDTVHNEGNQT